MNSISTLGAVPIKYRHWLWCLLTGTLLAAGLAWGNVCAQVSNTSTSHAATSREAMKIKRQVLQPALKMLRKKKVPFDPQLLLDDQWREKLKAAFAQIPEMKKDVHVTGPMKGVYLAASMLLPEQVELDGDTVILVRELAPEDENSTITISGEYRLVIFVIGDPKQYQAMRRDPARELLHVNVGGPCGIIGIAPVFRPRTQCVGMAFLSK